MNEQPNDQMTSNPQNDDRDRRVIPVTNADVDRTDSVEPEEDRRFRTHANNDAHPKSDNDEPAERRSRSAEDTGAPRPVDEIQFDDIPPMAEQQRHGASRPGASGGVPSPAERMAQNAREQAGAAASALRQGEFMRDAAVDPSADSDDRLIALLCYATQCLIPFIMPGLVLLSESSKKRSFQRFHAVQSLALTGIFAGLGVLLSLAGMIGGLVPILGWIVTLAAFCLTPLLLGMAWLALLYYGYQSYQGKRFAVPGLTALLRDQGWI